MFVCHQNYYIGSVYVGAKAVFCKLCPVGFLVVYECSSVLLQSIVMSYVDCGDDDPSTATHRRGSSTTLVGVQMIVRVELTTMYGCIVCVWCVCV